MSVLARLRRIRREVLGLNRRNHEHGIRANAPALVALVDNKYATKTALARHGIPVPATFATFSSIASLQHLDEACRQRQSFVLKPTRGAGGEGIVVILRHEGGRFYKASGETLWPRDLVAHAAEILAGAYALNQSRDEVLLEQRLELHPALEPFAYGGVPDIRVLVARGVPVLAMARLPTRMSDGRANLHLGGLGVGLDLRTGRAVHAAWRHRPVTEHPDTGRALHRLEVPHWYAILYVAAACFDAVPLGYFGVDLVVDPHVGPCVLELNARPGLGIQLANHLGLRRLLDRLPVRVGAPSADAPRRVALGLALYEQVVSTG